MNIGMLWHCDDKKKTLDQKVAEAAEYYFQKYGARPTECYVHKSMLEGGSRMSGGVKVRVSGIVHKNHLWIGVGE